MSLIRRGAGRCRDRWRSGSAYAITRRPGRKPFPVALEKPFFSGHLAMLTTWTELGLTFPISAAFMSPSRPVIRRWCAVRGCPVRSTIIPTLTYSGDFPMSIAASSSNSCRTPPSSIPRHIALAAHVHAAQVPHSHVVIGRSGLGIHRRNRALIPNWGPVCPARSRAILRLERDRVGQVPVVALSCLLCFSNGDPDKKKKTSNSLPGVPRHSRRLQPPRTWPTWYRDSKIVIEDA